MEEEAEIKISEKERQKSLDLSIREGSYSNVPTSLAENYMTPFALALNASPLQIGFLSSISGLAAPLSQFFSSRFLLKYNRKKIVLNFVLLSALMWIPVAVISLFMKFNIFSSYLPVLLIVFYSLLVSLSGFAYPAWFSWMGDLVPIGIRGRFFSKRNKILGSVGLITVIFAGFFLDFFKTKGLILIGFAILFSISCIFRLIARQRIKKMRSVRFKFNKGYYFSIFAFLKRMDNYGKFAIYQTFFNFAVMFASPFFAVYMLNELKFSYTVFMLVSISSTVFYLLFVPFAGKFSDKYGNVKLMFIAHLFFILTPILWVFFDEPLLLVLLPQLSAGISNAALVISTTNFTYDAVSQKHRPLCIAYTNVLAGIGIFLGSIAGGIFLKFYNPSGIGPYIALFSFAAIIRFLVLIFFMPRIKEVRKVKRVPKLDLFPSQIITPWKLVNNEIHWFKHVFR